MVTIMRKAPSQVDILILGAGWTSTFLIPLLEKENISYAATTTTGRDGTFKFKYEFGADNREEYEALPAATTVLITFPLKAKDQSTYLVKTYDETHDAHSSQRQYIQLGSTGIFTIPNQPIWVNRHSKYDESNARAIAEDELLQLGGCVLNLSGLWGGTRQPRNWVVRVAPTKEKLREKYSLHLVHGYDVARGIIAVHRKFSPARGQRFLLTDLVVHDWWALVLGFARDNEENENETDSPVRWVGELMAEKEVKALPRSMETLGRCYDSREFWATFELMPTRTSITAGVRLTQTYDEEMSQKKKHAAKTSYGLYLVNKG